MCTIFSCFAKFGLTIRDGGGMRAFSEIDGWGPRDEESTVFHVTQHGPRTPATAAVDTDTSFSPRPNTAATVGPHK